MTDPGLPPKPRSLNLLESLVKEEEAKAAEENRGAPNIDSPYDTKASARRVNEFYDTDKQQLTRENSLSASYSEFKMKDTEFGSKVKRGDPNVGFKGKKAKTQNSRSGSLERSKKNSRPYSADYNRHARTSNSSYGRPSTAKGRQRTSSPKARGRRSSYSSDSYSSDDDDKHKKYHSDSDDTIGSENESDFHDFFDSEKGSTKESKNKYEKQKQRRNHKDKKSTKRRDSGSEERRDKKRRDSSSGSDRRGRRSGSSDSKSSLSDQGESSANKMKLNGHAKRITRKKVKTVFINGNGHQRTQSDSDGERKVVVEDYSSISSSDDEKSEQRVEKPSSGKPPKPGKRLLSRKKHQSARVYQIDPDMYLEGKLHQKYTELEELLNCSFVDQRSHVTRHHLYQMELLRDQYQSASHGHMSSATIIPRSLPADIRNKSNRPMSATGPRRPISATRRPTSAKRATGAHRGSDNESENHAYKTLRSVMSAEEARRKDKIRTDINADTSTASSTKGKKKKKKIDVNLKAKKSDSEEETSERPSMASSKADSKVNSSLNTTTTTPRGKASAGIDHHIKYSENQKLKKWLKEKDKIYRQKCKEERKKKREEREKLIIEANEKIERRIKSQKLVKDWMKEKNKEYVHKIKEDRRREKEEIEKEKRRESMKLPGDAMRIRPQSAPARRSEDVLVDEQNIRGGDTPEYVKDQIHLKREINEENKQAKLAHSGAPHPPQTKFIYKRPVAGKIKLKMQIKGKSPTAESNKDTNEKSEEDKAKQMRMSYDDWVKKKRQDDIDKKKNAERQKQLAKSDPELERIIPALGRKRIEDKLNSRKRINTGIKSFDDKVNKSFGGGDFESSAKELPERPRSAYRLECDRIDTGEPALSVTSKQLQRPSTAPPTRGRPAFSPKKSVKSPRKAIIPTRADKVMKNEDTSNPYTLPFSPEKGIPIHVAQRQRKIFADIVTRNLNEIEQRALLNAELIKEGVSDEDIEKYRQEMEAEFAKYKNDQNDDQSGHSSDEDTLDDGDDVRTKEDEHPKITEIMYSPRKREDTSDSSSDENIKEDKSETTTLPGAQNENIENKTDDQESQKKDEQVNAQKADESANSQNLSSFQEENENTGDNVRDESDLQQNHTQYMTYENLNEVNDGNAHHHKLGLDSLLLHTGDYEVMEPEDDYYSPSEDERDLEPSLNESVKIYADPDPNVVGILKETKTNDKFPEPEASDEPILREKAKTEHESEEGPSGSKEYFSASSKRVSFNEKTEVFQSFESTSTDTVTPGPDDFDAKAESLDAHVDNYDFLFAQSSELKTPVHQESDGTNVEAEKVKETEHDDKETTNAFITNPDNES